MLVLRNSIVEKYLSWENNNLAGAYEHRLAQRQRNRCRLWLISIIVALTSSLRIVQ